jgi:hypothetical protein
MRFRNVTPLMIGLALGATGSLAGQDSAQAAAQQMQLRQMIEQIARERPQQAEVAAREMMRRLMLEQRMLDSLRARSTADYWAEIAQLTVQREMLKSQEDSARRALMAQMFTEEARARGLQRAYRDTGGADSAQARSIRERLQTILERHLAAEDSLRDLEVRDIERRLAQVRAETVRRRREREMLVRRMVEQVLEDARRP